ncbi:TolC family protein, partial [Nitrospira defluvii]|nr:TolC family protein [Nitrospira defluvii]
MSIVITVLSFALFIFLPSLDLSWAQDSSVLPESPSLARGLRSIQADDAHKDSILPSTFSEPTGIIKVEQVQAFALMNHPALLAVSWELRARDAARLQAGLLPNPVFGFDIENVIGSGAFSGTDASETTLSVEQRFETADKRSKRKKVAELERVLFGWDYETLRLDLFTEVSQIFVEVLGDQEKVLLAEDLLALAAQVVDVVERRVDAGKVSPVEAVKAKVSLALSKIELSRAERELIASRKSLAAMWGSTDPQFKSVAGQLKPNAHLQSFEELTPHLSQNPELARWDAELAQRTAVLDLEKANAIPDVSFGAGFRQFNETDDSALLAGISIDLPVFDRNQGNIQKARAQHSKALAARQATVLRLRTGLAQAYRFLSTTHLEAEGLKNEVLPGAQKAFDAVSEGYRLGKFDLLDVLDAQ